MTPLNDDWLTSGSLDFEYKKYLLLAYLQKVKARFRQHKLYPALADLVKHYRNAVQLKQGKTMMHSAFKAELMKIDINKLKMVYNMLPETDYMQELESILTFTIPQLKKAIEEGKDVYDFIEEQMEIIPVGVMPIYKKEGYLFIDGQGFDELQVYQFAVTVIENANERHHAVRTNLIDTPRKRISQSYENIKLSLIRRYKSLPNPATYLVVAHLGFPLSETIEPIAKRLLVKEIAQKAA